MKKIFNIIAAAALVLSISGCEKFLDRPSKTTLDDSNYWYSEDMVRLFVNGAYGAYFYGYGSGWADAGSPAVFNNGRPEYSDDVTTSGQLANICLSLPADNWYRGEQVQGTYSVLARRSASTWNFAYVRKWNLLIDRLNSMKEAGTLSEEAFNHWMGVARFFRGWEYSRLVESFGDVPYYGKSIDTGDFDGQFKDRDPRTKVMDAVLEDFEFAMKNVRINDGADFVNRYVVGTVASRCLLFEGTWYVYHKNDEALKTCTDVDGHAKTYLTKAMEFAGYVIDNGNFQFDTDFRTLFGSLYKRPASKEIIMYRAYNRSVSTSYSHCVASYCNGDESQGASGNLATLKAWICNDGQPYSSTTVANADSWRMQDMVVTRDPRFEATYWDEPKNSPTGMYVEKFIDRVGPTYSYNGKARPTQYASNTNENGFPVVRYAETVLNWLEAKAELAERFGGAAVTQSDLDKSINAIRKRPLDETAIAKGVTKTAPLQINNLPNDPERTAAPQKTTLGYKTVGAVSPLLWEIRRERRMEFFLEKVRSLDIRRWGQLELMRIANNPDLGIGGYVELDLTATLTASQAADLARPAQTTSLKKTKDNVGFNILTIANKGVVSVMPIDGYNADGTLKLKDRLYFDCTTTEVTRDGKPVTVVTASNYDKMRGFLVPQNIKDRDASDVEVRNYLEPICSQVIDQYKEKAAATGKDYSIYQNPGW